MAIKTLEDIVALEARPLAEHALPASTYDALAASAARSPAAKALSFFLTADSYDRPATWTYAEFLAEVTQAANAFFALGVSPEHPVAFVLPNLPETHFTIWGGEAAGAVLALNPLLAPAHLAELMRAAGTRVLVTLAPSPVANLWTGLAPHLGDLADLRSVALVDLAAYTGGMLPPATLPPRPDGAGFEIVDYRAMVEAQPAEALLSPRMLTPDSPSSYFCTGGTTGLPKIAARSHGNEVFDAWSVVQMLGEKTHAGQSNYFCGLPLFHVNAQLVTGLVPWMRGDHVVLGTPQGYRAEGLIPNFWEIVARHRISFFSGVPTIYAALLNVPVGDNDISSLDYGVCGAAPLPAKLIETFEAATDIKVLEGYGLTEAACVSSLTPPGAAHRAGSIGMRLPYQQMRAAIQDATGAFERWAETDEVGTLVLRGPNVFDGYLDPRLNTDLWIEIDGERWLNTGDLGREDGDGYFWLTGRLKELIIRGGHNIDPKIIEDSLAHHPAVALVAAVGSPDAHSGEIPVAYVQLKPDMSVSEAALLEHAAAHIPERAAVPKAVRILPTLPLTAVGKIFKPALTKRESEAAVRAEAEQAGAVITRLDFAPDGDGVEVMHIAVAGGAAALRAALSPYSFQFEISETGTEGAEA